MPSHFKLNRLSISVKPIQENSREVIETSKLTSLIESEFKCIICDEIFVDVSIHDAEFIRNDRICFPLMFQISLANGY